MNQFVFVTGETGLGDACAPSCLDEPTGSYFPHPQNCSLFYLCNHHIAFIHSCPGDLEFNPTINVCDYSTLAGCTSDPEYDCENPPTTTTPATTTEGNFGKHHFEQKLICN